MFAKIGGKNWKSGNVAKTLSKYFSMLDFGLNAQHTYGKAEDKPVWWPKRHKMERVQESFKVFQRLGHHNHKTSFAALWHQPEQALP